MTRPASYSRVWGESAASDQMGSETATADQAVIEDGWVGSATAEPPTARMQNYWQTRVDLGLQEIEQQGFLSWRVDVPYKLGALVTYAGYLFQAISANTGITPQGANDSNVWSFIQPGKWPTTTDNLSGVLPIVKGGTGAIDAEDARNNLGLGTAATYNVGVSPGQVPAYASGGALQVGPSFSAQHALQRAQAYSAVGAAILADTGTVANVYSAVNSLPYTTASLVHGVRQSVQFARANTGYSTYSPDGMGPFPIYGMNYAALKGGEIPLRGVGNLVFIVDAAVNSGNGAWILLNCTKGAMQIAPASYGDHAIQLQQATGRLLGAPQVFTSSGTYTPTPGMVSCIIEVQGGGAAGGGATVPSVGNISLGSPGTAGAYGRGRFLAAAVGTNQVVTVGYGGVGVSGASGNPGGSTSVGNLISAPGGVAGSALNNQVPPQYNGNGSNTAQPSGANIAGGSGTTSGFSFAQTAGFGYGGYGGSSFFGGAPGISPINSGGGTANNYGCGGNGVAAGSGSAVLAGGNGRPGLVIIWEYA